MGLPSHNPGLAVLDYIQHYQKQWKNLLQQMSTTQIPKAILKYRPNVKKSLGHPMKMWCEKSSVRSKQVLWPITCLKEEEENAMWVAA
jgi:hypothetical protein